MTVFATWTGIAHSILSIPLPSLKRSHAGECLAAWLGHRTYASFRVSDLAALTTSAKFLLIDSAAALERLQGLGYDANAGHWTAVEMALRPSSKSGARWITDMTGMERAACLQFEDQSHDDVVAIWRPIGTPDGRTSRRGEIVRETQVSGTVYPPVLQFSVIGEVRAFNEHDSLAVPAKATVRFVRVGRCMYAPGDLVSVNSNGPATSYEPDLDGETYGA